MLQLVNGTKIYYEVQGSGAPILLCHGNGEDHTIFDRLAAALAPNFTVYLPDTRGHGKSEPVPVLHYSDMAEDMAALIEALGLQKPVFYGFSDGGILGLLLASRYPGLLSRLAVSGANFAPDGLRHSTHLRLALRDFFLPDPLLDVMLREPCLTREDLAKIDVPTLVMAGEHDLIRPEHTRTLAQSIPVPAC